MSLTKEEKLKLLHQILNRSDVIKEILTEKEINEICDIWVSSALLKIAEKPIK